MSKLWHNIMNHREVMLKKRIVYHCNLVSNTMCCFTLPFLFGNSAYASQLLICVTMKEENSMQKVL
jgi:hypothetical protein